METNAERKRREMQVKNQRKFAYLITTHQSFSYKISSMLSRERHLCSLPSLPHTNNKLIISLRTWTDINKLIIRPLGGGIVPATLRGGLTHLISNLSCSRIKCSNGFTTNTKHTLIPIREEQDTQSQCVCVCVCVQE